MRSSFACRSALLVLLLRQCHALNPGCSPGGNFDLSVWSLQLPSGQPGSPDTESSGQLSGCSGFSNQYFFTESSDGALVMKVPGSPSSANCVTTPNSAHCRTELRENQSWDPNSALNSLYVSLAVSQPDESQYGTVIGQVHIDDSLSSKPVAELYYDSNGDLTIGVEQTRAGGDSIFTQVGNVPVGQTFSYELQYSSNVLSVTVNGNSAQTLSTYSLDSPQSYFKVGNYNQGNNPSDVHFFFIDVQHSSSGSGGSSPPPPPTRTYAPALTTISDPGIGPFEILTVLQRTLAPAPTAVCSGSQPAVPASNIVSLNLYSDETCCSSVESINMGTLNSCHTGNAAFQSLYQAVGSSMFGQDIHIMLYDQPGCTGGVTEQIKLTNNVQCWSDTTVDSQPWKSFMIAESSGVSTCAVVPSQNTSLDTVTLSLFSDAGCCDTVETAKLGQLNSCHNANAGFQGLSQTVGQDMFGKGIHVLTYPTQNCQGTPGASLKLTNEAICWYNSGTQGLAWQSFELAVSTTTTPSCPAFNQPTNTDANTVTLGLYSDSSCCTASFETIKVGNLAVCHKSTQPMSGLTQSVGSNLFGQSIHVQLYADANCASSNFVVLDLSNNAICYDGFPQYASFMVVKGGTSPPATSCAVQPANTNDNTLTVSLFTDASCCSAAVQTFTIGNLGSCHTAKETFYGITQSVGKNLFGQSNHILVYSDQNCAGNPWVIDLSNKDVCIFAAAWQSFEVMQGVSTVGSGSSVCQGASPTGKDDNSVTLNLYQGPNGCCSLKETISVGDLSRCHSSESPFTGVTQAVGSHMFGQAIHVLLYSDNNCGSETYWALDLSNKDVCDFAPGTVTWNSFQLVIQEPLPISSSTPTSVSTPAPTPTPTQAPSPSHTPPASNPNAPVEITYYTQPNCQGDALVRVEPYINSNNKQPCYNYEYDGTQSVAMTVCDGGKGTAGECVCIGYLWPNCGGGYQDFEWGDSSNCQNGAFQSWTCEFSA